MKLQKIADSRATAFFKPSKKWMKGKTKEEIAQETARLNAAPRVEPVAPEAVQRLEVTHTSGGRRERWINPPATGKSRKTWLTPAEFNRLKAIAYREKVEALKPTQDEVLAWHRKYPMEPRPKEVEALLGPATKRAPRVERKPRSRAYHGPQAPKRCPICNSRAWSKCTYPDEVNPGIGICYKMCGGDYGVEWCKPLGGSKPGVAPPATKPKVIEAHVPAQAVQAPEKPAESKEAEPRPPPSEVGDTASVVGSTMSASKKRRLRKARLTTNWAKTVRPIPIPVIPCPSPLPTIVPAVEVDGSVYPPEHHWWRDETQPPLATVVEAALRDLRETIEAMESDHGYNIANSPPDTTVTTEDTGSSIGTPSELPSGSPASVVVIKDGEIIADPPNQPLLVEGAVVEHFTVAEEPMEPEVTPAQVGPPKKVFGPAFIPSQEVDNGPPLETAPGACYPKAPIACHVEYQIDDPDVDQFEFSQRKKGGAYTTGKKIPILDVVVEGPFGSGIRDKLQNSLEVECPELEAHLRTKFMGMGVKANTRMEMGKYAADWLKKNRPNATCMETYRMQQTACTAALKPDYYDELYRQQMKQVVTNHQIAVQDQAKKGDLGRGGFLRQRRFLPFTKDAAP